MLVSVADRDCDHEPLAMVDLLLLHEEQRRCWKCNQSASVAIVSVSDIVANLVWAGAKCVTVLKPLHAIAQPDI